MTYPSGDIGPAPSPDDELTEAAALHILLLQDDRACAPAAEQGSAD